MKWISYMYAYIHSLLDLPGTLCSCHPIHLSHHTEHPSLAHCYTVGSHYLLYTWLCTHVNPNLSIHPLPCQCSCICFLCLCLFLPWKEVMFLRVVFFTHINLVCAWKFLHRIPLKIMLLYQFLCSLVFYCISKLQWASYIASYTACLFVHFF